MPSIAVFRINFVPLSAKDEVIMNHWEYILQSTKAEMKEFFSENEENILWRLCACGDSWKGSVFLFGDSKFLL